MFFCSVKFLKFEDATKMIYVTKFYRYLNITYGSILLFSAEHRENNKTKDAKFTDPTEELRQ